MDNIENRYTQKAWGTKLGFDFQEDELVYSAKITNTISVSQIPYLSISNKKWEFNQRNTWFRNVGILWIGVGIVFGLPSFGGDPESLLWCVFGVIMIAVYFVTSMKFTVVQTERERIMILKNKDHDVILKTLLDLRKLHLKKKYGEINPDNQIDAEKKKFDLLLKEGVISKEEHDAAHKQIEDDKKTKLIPSPFM
jgi:hypothetical protein